MADLIDTTEMHLKTILELKRGSGYPRAPASWTAWAYQPTVSQTVARMGA